MHLNDDHYNNKNSHLLAFLKGDTVPSTLWRYCHFTNEDD